MSVGAAGLVFLLLFGLAVPIAAYRSRDRLTSMYPRPSRRRVYISVLIQLAVFLALAEMTARLEDVSLRHAPQPMAAAWVVSALLLLVMVFATRGIRRDAVQRREPRVYFAMPQGRTEQALWIALSIMAGIAEEAVYRGVFAVLAERLTGSLPLAWALAVAAFTVAHANQGARSAAVIAVFSLVAHVLVAATGTLFYVIVLHAAYDIFAGFDYARLARRYSYPPEGVPDAVPDVTLPPGASSP